MPPDAYAPTPYYGDAGSAQLVRERIDVLVRKLRELARQAVWAEQTSNRTAEKRIHKQIERARADLEHWRSKLADSEESAA